MHVGQFGKAFRSSLVIRPAPTANEAGQGFHCHNGGWKINPLIGGVRIAAFWPEQDCRNPEMLVKNEH
ncbi:MAG: hypothetical protein H6Q07_628, partial [Acidobacteria bacterium]|nr:hypothetical protein [Acidobacteriota bacterium]